ncbi:MAG: PilZ domain-containing protein [Candidatus Omnitrophota bacterium]
MQERRCIPRWQVDRQAKATLEGALTCTDCSVKDINFKGCQLALGMKLHSDTFTKIKLCLSDDCTLYIEAWVAWHRTIDVTNVYGLYFSKINDNDKEQIYQFVRKNFSEELTKKWWPDTQKGGEDMVTDRRIFARTEAKLPLRFINLKENEEGSAEAQDISAKGMGLVTTQGLNTDTPLEMWLEIPDREAEPLYVRGNVVWSRKLEEDKFRVGVSLEKADFMGLSRVLRAMKAK